MQNEIFFQLTKIIGGAGLFIYGMKVMTHSLEEAAGSKLRSIISKLMKNQISGMMIGTLIAFLIHSGAATVMMVGFVNSGLMTFLQPIGFMIGTNLGTTLSMQVISFDIGKYCFLFIGLGFLINMFSKNVKVKHIGIIMIGFGILFLGMETMKDAVSPFKKSPFITRIFNYTDATTFLGMASGIALSTIATAVMQSSGAMIGILFALCGSGVITHFNTVFPLIIGAHIGTCIVTVIGAIGTNTAARRSAWAHVMFNVIGAVMAAIMYPIYSYIIPRLSSNNIVREVANTHTIVQTINGLIFLLLIPLFVKFMNFIVSSKEAEEHGTFLDNDLLEKPERAIVASISELERMLGITRRMLKDTISGFKDLDRKKFSRVSVDEESTDKLKNAIADYCVDLGQRKLSSRQSFMIQFINQTAIDIERIGDHIEKIIEFTLQRIKKNIWYKKDDFDELQQLFILADAVLVATTNSLNPDRTDFSEAKVKLANAIKDYKTYSKSFKDKHYLKIKEHTQTAIEGYYIHEYILYFDRIVKHLARISIIENDQLFFIKNEKLDWKAPKI
ncbi:MAG: Na/Pi-cotransporter family protein/PhoU family protein [Parcubacteria group bacterium GW2011_GWF2_46_8]|nr:MAG: Na/Pi-cotransporter family protein/PhoU family protein [Parcubacteria group bacterium GW2011_GWF2_46_8]